MDQYEVLVGNVGSVYKGNDLDEAIKDFHDYVRMSNEGVGRASYENVSFFKNGEPITFHYGRNKCTS